MATETLPQIRSVDVTTADLIDGLAAAVESEDGEMSEKLFRVLGEPEHERRMLELDSIDNIDIGEDIFDPQFLVEDGEVRDQIELLGREVDVNVV